MAITLSRKAYVQYRCFGMADQYPKSTEQAVSELRSRGYDASVPAMNYLIKQGKVSPIRGGRNYEWHPEHIDQAAAQFDEQEAYSLEARAFQYLGIDAEGYLRALHEAWNRLSEEFGDVAVGFKPNADYFVMHVHPPLRHRDGYVEFTLTDEAREQLERDSAMNQNVKSMRPQVRRRGRQ